MTLIEMLLYMGLLAVIFFGSVFSAYSILLSQEREQNVTASLYQ